MKINTEVLAIIIVFINTILAGAAFYMMQVLRRIRETCTCLLNELIGELIRNIRFV